MPEYSRQAVLLAITTLQLPDVKSLLSWTSVSVNANNQGVNTAIIRLRMNQEPESHLPLPTSAIARPAVPPAARRPWPAVAGHGYPAMVPAMVLAGVGVSTAMPAVQTATVGAVPLHVGRRAPEDLPAPEPAGSARIIRHEL